MDNNYQPPPIPGTSTGMYNISGQGGNAPTPNPFFTQANQFLPRNLHDVIRWAKYITVQSPVTTEVIRKLSTYPITEFVTDTKSDTVRKKYNEVYASFKLKQTIFDIGFEYYTVGNVFVSIYFPIYRSLTCPSCKMAYNAKKAEFTNFKNYEFLGTCPQCNYKGVFTRTDTKSVHVPDMNLIKWDPINIVVNNNPITGENEYFYKIPNDVKRRIQTGDKLFVNSVPWGIIEAVKKNQDFKFDNNHIYHLKNVSAGHAVNGIAVPPLISLYGLVFYQATLRRANESISNEFMAPLRAIYPMPQTGASDPVASISMRNFQAHMTKALARHRQDKSSLLISPVPIGYQAISGEGKTLLISQEIAQAEESMLLSLGVSRELLTGVTNWQSSTVGLRLLQNTMTTYTDQIVGLVNWVMTHVSKYLSLETCPISLVPFKLTDDDNLRQTLMQLCSSGAGSMTTLFESYGMSYKDELEQIQKDAILKAVSEVELKFAVEQAVFIASKEVTDKFDRDNDYRMALSKAQQIAGQLYQTDPMTRLQTLQQLQLTDYPTYVMVSRLIEEFDKNLGMVGDPNDPNAGANGEAEPTGPTNGPGPTMGPEEPAGPPQDQGTLPDNDEGKNGKPKSKDKGNPPSKGDK